MARFVIRFTTGKKSDYEVFKSNDLAMFLHFLDYLNTNCVRIISIRMDDEYHKFVNNF